MGAKLTKVCITVTLKIIKLDHCMRILYRRYMKIHFVVNMDNAQTLEF